VWTSMNQRLCSHMLAASSLVFACLVGCGGSEFGASASGTVTLDGKPVTPGLVTFAPEDPAAVPSVSDLDTSGGFTLTTNKKPGLTPGKYRVSIQAFRPPNVAPGERSFEPSEPLVPEKYLRVNTSGLEFTVEPGENTFDIELTSP
jgi:hypothetical protein